MSLQLTLAWPPWKGEQTRENGFPEINKVI